MSARILLVGLLVGLLASALAQAARADALAEQYAARGPHPTRVIFGTGPAGAYTLFRPSSLEAGGPGHPVLTWGNGTLAIPLFYYGLLDHLASWGYVVVASNSSFAGSGREMLAGVEWLRAQNADPDSALFQSLDLDAIGAAGHSQGGRGATEAGNDPRVRSTALIQPTPGNVSGLQGPTFILAGGRDTWVPAEWIATAVAAPAPAPAIFAIHETATHFTPLGSGGVYRGYVTAWFQATLRGDPLAARVFGVPCTLCADREWLVFRKLTF